jgi:undecaprenyl diphosphate synthase
MWIIILELYYHFMETSPPSQPSTPHRIPTHIAVIMDGNGRWAKSRGWPRLLGHRAGSQNIRTIIGACIERGVQFLTLYAFSTENWARPKLEVRGLMHLIGDYIDRETPNLHKMGVKILHIGDIDGLSKSLQKKIRWAVELTRNNKNITVAVALNYGGRHDIIQAVRNILASGVSSEQVTEKMVSDHLGTREIPEPDLVIRTSGETRLSNFLVWETAYSELWFTPVLWPDFNSDILDQALNAYSGRSRRFGGLSSQAAPPTVSPLTQIKT